MCTPTIVGIALTALPRHASAHLDGVLNEPRSSSDRMLLSRAGLAGAPAIKLGSPMNVEMPLAELDDLARSARALELHAAGPPSPMGPPPEIDQQVPGRCWPTPERCSSVAPADLCASAAALGTGRARRGDLGVSSP